MSINVKKKKKKYQNLVSGGGEGLNEVLKICSKTLLQRALIIIFKITMKKELTVVDNKSNNHEINIKNIDGNFDSQVNKQHVKFFLLTSF